MLIWCKLQILNLWINVLKMHSPTFTHVYTPAETLCDASAKPSQEIRFEFEFNIQHNPHLSSLCLPFMCWGWREGCDGCTNGSMIGAEWLCSVRGGDLTREPWTSELHTARLLVLLTATGNTRYKHEGKHEATLCPETWNTQGIPGRIPGDICLGCK